MFPLVHHIVNRKIAEHVTSEMVMGALWPDMAIGAKVNRQLSHSGGEDFFLWCEANAPDYLDLARGVISHGSTPGCVDYYADEYLPAELAASLNLDTDGNFTSSPYFTSSHTQSYPKGLCFTLGEKYVDAVKASTNLPDDLIWWKAHNFVEMGYELLTNQAHPDLRHDILEVVRNPAEVGRSADVLAEYFHASASKIKIIFSRVPILFALDPVTPEQLVRKQLRMFIIKFGHSDINKSKMIELLEEMTEDLRPTYAPVMDYLVRQAAQTMSKFKR